MYNLSTSEYVAIEYNLEEALLHGYCNYLALYLAKYYKFNVVLWCEYDDELECLVLIHAFNSYKDKYIDVRGVLTDEEEVIDEFDYLYTPHFTVCSYEGATELLNEMGVVSDDPVIIDLVKDYVNNQLSFKITHLI